MFKSPRKPGSPIRAGNQYQHIHRTSGGATCYVLRATLFGLELTCRVRPEGHSHGGNEDGGVTMINVQFT